MEGGQPVLRGVQLRAQHYDGVFERGVFEDVYMHIPFIRNVIEQGGYVKGCDPGWVPAHHQAPHRCLKLYEPGDYSFNEAQSICAAQDATLFPTYRREIGDLSDVLPQYYQNTMTTNISLWVDDPEIDHPGPGMCAWQNSGNEPNYELSSYEEQWGIKSRDCDDSDGNEKIGFVCKMENCDRFSDWADMGTGVKFASPAIDPYGNEVLNEFTSIFRAQIVCIGLLTGCSGVHGRYVKDENWGYPIYQLGRGNIIPSDDHQSTFSRPENPCSHYEDDGCPVGAKAQEAGSDTGGVLISSTLSILRTFTKKLPDQIVIITNADLKFSKRFTGQ